MLLFPHSLPSTHPNAINMSGEQEEQEREYLILLYLYSYPPIPLGGAASNISGEQGREFSIYGGFIDGYCCHHVDFGTSGHIRSLLFIVLSHL